MPQYMIEVCGPKNDNHSWPMAGLESVRGRWNVANIAHRDMSPGLAALTQAVSVIPGRYICIDTDKQEGMVVDPLAETVEGRAICAKISEVLKRFNGMLEHDTANGVMAHPPVVKYLDVDGVKTWAYQMAQMVESGMAVNVPTAQPLPKSGGMGRAIPPDSIRAWPGKRDTTAGVSQGFVDEKTRWADDVPVPSEKPVAPQESSGRGNSRNNS